jgi:hypothetical protein
MQGVRNDEDPTLSDMVNRLPPSAPGALYSYHCSGERSHVIPSGPGWPSFLAWQGPAYNFPASPARRGIAIHISCTLTTC